MLKYDDLHIDELSEGKTLIQTLLQITIKTWQKTNKIQSVISNKFNLIFRGKTDQRLL